LRLARLSRASGQTRPLQLGALWIAPLVYLGLASLVIAAQPPRGWEWLWLVAGAGIGGALGWWRGKTVEILVHPATGSLSARTSSAAAVFLLAVMLLKLGLRYLLVGEAGALHLTVKLITGTFMAFALGLIVTQRVEMTLRAMRLLSAALGPGPKAREPDGLRASPASAEAAPTGAEAMARVGLSNAQLAMLGATVFIVIVIAGLALSR
jgi:hypothetical protein